MKKVEFMKYETPVVEIIEVEVEKGFETSTTSLPDFVNVPL